MLDKYKKILKEKGEVYLRIKVRPGSKNNNITEVMEDDTIKINIMAPAIKGKANKKLIKVLVKIFHVYEKNIKIISGAKEKIKLIKLNK